MIFTKQELQNIKKLTDSIKAKDAVSLKPGDWFCDARRSDNPKLSLIFKVIRNDKISKRLGGILVERYEINNGDNRYDKPVRFKVINTGPVILNYSELEKMHITVFNSDQEALKWVQLQVDRLNARYRK